MAEVIGRIILGALVGAATGGALGYFLDGSDMLRRADCSEVL